MAAIFQQTVVATAASATSVAASQTPAGAGALTLTASPVTFTNAQLITATSAGNDSNRTLTIVGTDANGNALTANLTGPNANTVTTTLAFKTVSSVTISGAAAAALTMGNAANAEGSMWVVDMDANPFSVSLGVIATTNFTVQYTYDDVLSKTYSYATGVWWNITALAAKTANTDTAITAPVRAFKMILGAAGTVSITGLQTGAGNR